MIDLMQSQPCPELFFELGFREQNMFPYNRIVFHQLEFVGCILRILAVNVVETSSRV
jgi:hypothetical protein